MKLSELKPCARCGGPIAPSFYVIRVSQAIITPAANTTLGLAQIFHGSLALADAMTSQPSPVKVLGDEEPALMTQFFLCRECACMHKVNVIELAEMEEADGAAAI